MRRGISHSGIVDQRLTELETSDGTRIEDDVEPAALSSARLIQELTAERDRLRRALVSFEEDAELRRELLRVAEPEAALQIAADSISRGSGVPVCFWWSEHQGTLELSVASGVRASGRQNLQDRMGTIPAWTMLTAQERTALRRRFGAAVGAKHVTAYEVDGAVLMVGSGEAELRPRVRAVGSLLDEILPLLAATARERRRNMEIDLGLAWTAHELSGPLLSIKAALELLVGSGVIRRRRPPRIIASRAGATGRGHGRDPRMGRREPPPQPQLPGRDRAGGGRGGSVSEGDHEPLDRGDRAASGDG